MSNKENKYYKMLDFFNDNENDGKLRLTRNNADFIEAVLMIDSNYKNSSNPNIKPSIEYVEYLEENEKNVNIYNDKLHQYGSSSYWIQQFVKIIDSNDKAYEVTLELENEKGNNKEKVTKKINLENVLKGVVCAIDRENSTHLTAHQGGERVGRSNVSAKIFEYIKENGLKEFKNKLLEDDKFYLVGYITVPLNPNEENYHYSFATKFCKYVSQALDSDRYYIYDNIIISNIDYYIKKCHLEGNYKKKNLEFDKDKYKNKTNEEELIGKQYEKLHNCLDEIRESENQKEITRNEMDHLIWYPNK